MTVYINGKFLCQQTTGVQSYARAMLASLRLLNVDVRILTPKTAPTTDKYHVTKVGFFSNLVLWEQISLPFYMRKQTNAVLINFCNSAPLWYGNQIVTIHDLAFEKREVPWFSFFFKTWYRFLIPKICSNSLRVFTVSDFSKKELVARYKLPEQKVEIVPNAFVPIKESAERKTKENYVLMIGAGNPRKNVKWVLDRIKEIEDRGLKLVLITSRSDVFATYELSSSPSVIVLDHVSHTEYYSLIRHCTALIYPSLYEGFGIPILESLCLGRPAICNDLPVFRESFGTLPIYLDLLQENSLSEALSKTESWSISDEEIDSLKLRFNMERSGQLIVKTLKQLA